MTHVDHTLEYFAVVANGLHWARNVLHTDGHSSDSRRQRMRDEWEMHVGYTYLTVVAAVDHVKSGKDTSFAEDADVLARLSQLRAQQAHLAKATFTKDKPARLEYQALLEEHIDGAVPILLEIEKLAERGVSLSMVSLPMLIDNAHRMELPVEQPEPYTDLSVAVLKWYAQVKKIAAFWATRVSIHKSKIRKVLYEHLWQTLRYSFLYLTGEVKRSQSIRDNATKHMQSVSDALDDNRVN